MDDLKSPPRTARALAKRERIVGCAMRQFAEDGYPGARVEDIATELAIAKGSIVQYFGSKAGLFLEVYKHAVASLPAWLDAPQGTLDEGFFATVAFWLERTEHLVKRAPRQGGLDPLPRVADRELRYRPRAQTQDQPVPRERGPLLVDWLSGSLQDALVTQELDPGLFHRWQHQPDRQRMRVEHFAVLLRSAIGADPSQTG
jgi:AcrR family transcriptional regulator